ncbi:cx9C motif-containing protein 4 [Chrysoperla carnea]|uniref:cx9C motif-containing protein 4 n=1 Tax=Chrysoperla carnea TaxID=189513 RepID=UPI001D064EF5|nr:cx9C motif-containing protein 4 [Chrysoperla carnea]
MPKPYIDPCKKFACRIQKCLQEHNFQEDRCQLEIEELRQCCVKWKSESICCSGIDIPPKKEEAPEQ